MTIKRYKAQNVFDMEESEDGAFVLYTDAMDLLEDFIRKSVKAGASEEELMEVFSDDRN